jgi:hypothetical protein
VRHEPGNAADRAGLALEIEGRDVAFGGGVELENPRDAEAAGEVRPHVGAQAIAAAQPDPVSGLVGTHRAIRQIPAQLADVEEQRAVPGNDVVPEFARGEFLADDDRPAADQHRARRHHAAVGVIHRQRVVHAVAGPRIHHAGKTVARQHQPVVIDVRGLGQAGGAGGVDVERPILDGEGGALGTRKLLRRAIRDGVVDAGKLAVGPVRPDFGVGRQLGARRQKRRQELGGDDDVLGLDDVDAMRERGSGKIGVDERHHAAGAGDAEPDRHVFGAVGHQQADGVALGEAVCARPARVAVGALGKLAIAQVLAGRKQGRRVAEFLRELLDHDGENPGRMLGDRRRHPERPQGAPEEGDVALQPLDQPHAFPPMPAHVSERRSAGHYRGGPIAWQARLESVAS